MIAINLLTGNSPCTGRCCRRTAMPGMKTCPKHYRNGRSDAKYSIAIKAKRSALGLCRKCDHPRLSDSVFCEPHRKKSREDLKKYRNTERGQEVTKISRLGTYLNRKAEGRCPCGKPAREGKIHCALCADKYSKSDNNSPVKQKTRRVARIASGHCSVCDQPPVPGKTFCEYHRDQSRIFDTQQRNARRASGLCLHCQAPVVDGIRGAHRATKRKRTTCDACAARRYNTPLRRFKGARSATQNTVGWSLSFDEWHELVTKPCHYCDFLHLEQSGRGLDRLDNGKGYHDYNVVSCCPECNMVRNNIFTPEEMKLLGKVVRQIKLARITTKGLDR